MRKAILYISLGFLSLLFLGAIFYAVASMQSVDLGAFTVSASTQTSTTRADTKVKNWVQELASVTPREQYFPVNELYMELSLQEAKPPKEHIFQLLIDKSDSYSYFCLIQTLKFFSVPYNIVMLNNKQTVLVNAKNKNELNKIAIELKKYNINSSIKEAWL